MSTTRDHGDYVFQCDTDGCRETLETNTSNWSSAHNLLRRAKWQPFPARSGGPEHERWNHRCAQCAKGQQLPLRRPQMAGAR